MIGSFRHAGLELFYRSGSERGVDPTHAGKLLVQLAALDVASKPGDTNVPGWRLHRLSKDLDGHGSVRVNGNWRVTFAFDGEDAIPIDYTDHH